MFELLHEIEGISDGIKRTGDLKSGARFFKCALQVNPYGYAVRHPKGESGHASQVEYDAAMVAAARDAGIEVVALMDHFRVETSETLRAAMKGAGIVAFPGFEACSSEGVHLLCLFQPTTPLLELQNHIGACDLRDRDSDSPQSRHGCERILELVYERNGLAIAAHVLQQQRLAAAHARRGADRALAVSLPCRGRNSRNGSRSAPRSSCHSGQHRS